MSRRLLPLAMLVSLWPVAFIAVGLATASKHRSSNTVDVTVPSATTTPAATPHKATIRLKANGRTYYCPPDTQNKLKPINQRLGELQLEVTAVRRQLRQTIRRLSDLDKLYPGHTAPTQAIADEYNGLLRAGRRLDASESPLVRAFNTAVDEHNHVLETDCS